MTLIFLIDISYKFVDIRSPAPDIDATLEMTQEYKDTEGTCTIDETLVEEKELSTGRKRKVYTVITPEILVVPLLFFHCLVILTNV